MKLKDFLLQNEAIKKVDDEVYLCSLCNKSLKYDPTQGIKQLKRHVKNDSHVKRLSLSSSNIEAVEDTVFNKELSMLFFKCNIAFSNLENPTFKSFIEKYTKRHLMSKKHFLGKVITEVYDEELTNVLSTIRGHNFGIMTDETIDFTGRKIINILVFKLEFEKYNKPILINTLEVESTKSELLAQKIMFEVQRLVNGPSECKNLRLLVTDGAAYCIKLGKLLKEIIPSIVHVTCLAHALHNLSEKIRLKTPNVNAITASLTKIFKHSKRRRKEFEEQVGYRLHGFPVITRWGTWISFVKFIYNHFNDIETYLINQTDKVYLELKQLFMNDAVMEEMNTMQSFFTLPDLIKQLEKQSLTVFDQMAILKKAKELDVTNIFKTTFENILSKNPNLEFFTKFNVLRAKENDKCMNFAPLTTVDVERSFSKMKHLLGDKKTKMSVENLKRFLFFYYNK